jgi:hypothetical protein
MPTEKLAELAYDAAIRALDLQERAIEGLVFEISPSRIYESLFEVAEDEPEIRRRLAYWLEDFWRSMRPRLTSSAAPRLTSSAATTSRPPSR